MKRGRTLEGTIIGYDPGGDDKHGFACAHYQDGSIQILDLATHRTLEDVLQHASAINDLIAIGIDTLTLLSTGSSGWRPADRWLRSMYPAIIHSIASPNSLFGSMGLNGMAFLKVVKGGRAGIAVSETHPKVLFYELFSSKYDYKSNGREMDKALSTLLNTEVVTKNDHEWDAAMSVYAVFMGITGQWTRDLHALSVQENERLIRLVGDSNYWWPN